MRRLSLCFLMLLLLAVRLPAAITAEQAEFFEKKIRPILVQECVECHNSTGKKKGGLALDSRAGWQAGGEGGEAIVPGDLKGSLLLQSIRHEDPDLKMPQNGAKLEPEVIHAFEQWVAMGAPDPRDRPPSPEELQRDRDWPHVLERRRAWWSFQPVQHPPVPAATAWSQAPVDRFLQSRMAQAGLAPAPAADPATTLRRLTYVLTGLAPTPVELHAFTQAAARDLPAAVGQTADRLLASPQYGERWARHWMDWVRYAETHGSEGDPKIPYAWRYRDYLIRAFNADVPYPQMVREALAGDLLPHPRLNTELGLNESALGPAHLRMVLHGFTPTDALDEQATFTDNQIDTVTKSFLGLTVACARCHNHKFDAISQADYYALYGIFASSRPATVDVSLPERRAEGRAELQAMKAALRATLAQAWQAAVPAAVERLTHWTPTKQERAEWPAEQLGPMAAWWQLSSGNPAQWPRQWAEMRVQWAAAEQKLAAFRTQSLPVRWDLRGPESATWQVDGPGVAGGPTAAGEFALEPEGSRVVTGIYPAGLYSHGLSSGDRALLNSPPFQAEGGRLFVRVRGDGGARVRYVVQNYPRTGTVYHKVDLVQATDQWVNWNLDYWKGEKLYLEVATEGDQPVESKKFERSWFGVSEVIYVPEWKGEGPPAPGAPLLALLPAGQAAPASREELLALYQQALQQCVEHWKADTLTDLEADFLDTFVRAGLLPNTLAGLPAVQAQLASYRTAVAHLAVPVRAPGVLEGYAFDQPLFTRGDHKHQVEPVPRRFLDALDARPYPVNADHSGRLELAESMVAPTNPLTSRVMVNRLWHHVFGQGLVATPDNFGRLGEAPSHPELLDYLAGEFQAQGGSIKGFLRTLVTSRAFRQDHHTSPAAEEKDPQNRLLSHFSLRRLEAEAIRDSMVVLTGRLKAGAGPEPEGPGSYRRSVYGEVVRNRINPLLAAFDFPTPVATRGRRDSTNVPAQALALLNDANVSAWATQWTERLAQETVLAAPEARIARMWEEAFARQPAAAEMQGAAAFVEAAGWAGLAQALFNAKEFIYLP